ncbi:unnamed protein product [Urochloa decumbens]|uniref:thermospermine synthase n=1 Tax=Urochloa decumbens TaxID=240449 RepID=A0ABC9EL13_9POAL
MVGAVQDYGRVGESNGGLETNGYESRAAKVKQAPRRGGEEEESVWYEEEIDDDLKLCYALNSVLHRGASKYQEIALIDTKHFGKALIIDGKMQSAEADEFIYHESLIHPPLLFHPNPKTVFIMGGGEGSAAREVLRHSTVQRVVMCDIDEEVVDFCRAHLSANRAAFASDRLRLVIDDARAELEKSSEKFDVIVGDLADPVEGGPCYQLYTKGFYDRVVKPKLSDGRGVFVTQAGPAGVLTHREVFSSIYNTLRHVFKCIGPSVPPDRATDRREDQGESGRGAGVPERGVAHLLHHPQQKRLQVAAEGDARVHGGRREVHPRPREGTPRLN